MPVVADLQRQACLSGHRYERLPHAPFPRLHHDQPLGSVDRVASFCGAGLRLRCRHRSPARQCQIGEQACSQACRLIGQRLRSQAPVDNPHPLRTQLVAEVPHGGKKEHDPGLMRPDVCRFLDDLRHPDAVA